MDRIYYHNAYRVTPTYKPQSETDRALFESLKSMELQCKERVELLEALRDSRKELENDTDAFPKPHVGGSYVSFTQESPGFIGGGTIPAVNYPDLAKPPALPRRPVPTQMRTSSSRSLRPSMEPLPSQAINERPLGPIPTPPILPKTSRTPSPDKRSKMKMTLRTSKDPAKGGKGKQSFSKPPAASKAAGLAWESKDIPKLSIQGSRAAALNSGAFTSQISQSETHMSNVPPVGASPDSSGSQNPLYSPTHVPGNVTYSPATEPVPRSNRAYLPAPPASFNAESAETAKSQTPIMSSSEFQPSNKLPTTSVSYRNEFSHIQPISQASVAASVNPPKVSRTKPTSSSSSIEPKLTPTSGTKPKAPSPVPNKSRPEANAANRRKLSGFGKLRKSSSDSDDERKGTHKMPLAQSHKMTDDSDSDGTPDTSGRNSPDGDINSTNWEERLQYVKKNLPRGVDPWACRQIFNEIVVKGDEVHWSDVAGLEQAKTALKEAVVYPFLRPDLFMGLREPARGMLLFGPPGTGKTMLARAVATESKSTFFAISASSLTSKWLGESEKLVKALFALARALAPSIIFVDEIDSLLSSRGGSSEHESTRRIKTEFLIEWSALQRAAAGKEQTEKERKDGDATRVLVLAATNLPWAIDDAARRRFVRRQYIPLPEPHVREEQIRTLLSHQKHSLSNKDIRVLVDVTDGKILFSYLNMQANEDRLFWIRYNGPGERCSYGAFKKSWRGTSSYDYGSDKTDQFWRL